MGIEEKVHRMVSNMPMIKKSLKRIYQFANVSICRPKKSEGDIIQITPNDEYEYFFGYYDKSPWDITNRYMLCLRAKNTTKSVAPKEPADIVLIDTQNNNSIKKIATTHSWNVQQGCMAGWLGPNFKDKIFYNDFRNGKHRGIILDINTGEETIYDMPFYTVSNDGKIALTLDFTRLHRLRPGYGYSNLEDKTKGEKVPDAPCIWRIDLESKKITPILKYEDLYSFEHRKEMEQAEHKVNHLMLSPNGKRFMVIHRWLKGGKKFSRLITCDIDGENLYNLSDENMVSHCYWKNDKEILSFCRKNNTDGYYLMKDKTQEYERKWDFLSADGHPSYSPDGKHVVTDTYPNRNRISTITVLSDKSSTVIAKVRSPFKYDNDVRCDLHPRWNRDGKKIAFDTSHTGKRGLFYARIEGTSPKDKLISIITPIHNTGEQIEPLINSLNKQSNQNFELILIDDGSDNKSEELVVQKLKKANFKYTYLKNRHNIGAGKSRNKGIDAANGDYIIFVDSDDYVSRNLIQELLVRLQDNDTIDIILYDLKRIKGKKNTVIKTLKGFKEGLITKKEVLLYSANCVAGKCIKKSIIRNNEIVFPSLVRYEDWVFNCRCYACSKTFYYINKALYIYINHPGSLVNKNKNIDLECAEKAYNLIKKEQIDKSIIDFLYMREVGYLYIKKRIFKRHCSCGSMKLSNEIKKEYATFKHLKANKYIAMKIAGNSTINRIINKG